jgi:chromosome segregation ATPase
VEPKGNSTAVEHRSRRHHIDINPLIQQLDTRLVKKAAPEGGGVASMSQPEALQQATERLDSAVDQLETFLRQVFSEAEDGVSAAALKEQVRFLTEERDRLLRDLDAEKDRVRRLKTANVEVSDRLETVMGTLKDLMPAFPG